MKREWFWIALAMRTEQPLDSLTFMEATSQGNVITMVYGDPLLDPIQVIISL